MSNNNFVVFVGDKPSTKNKNKNIAFVGTKSYKKLLEWIYLLDLDINVVYMCNKSDVTLKNCKISGSYLEISTPSIKLEIFDQDIVIALGESSFKHLNNLTKKSDKNFNITRLPHPSGLNRILNNKTFLKKELARVKNTIQTGRV